MFGLLVLAALMAILALGALSATDVHAEEDWAVRDGSVPNVNPYPEAFSDEEITATGGRDIAWKTIIRRNGEVLPQPEQRPFFDVEPGDEVSFYLVLMPHKWDRVGLNFGFWALYPTALFNDKGDARIGSLENKNGDDYAVYLKPEVRLNGKPLKDSWDGAMWESANDPNSPWKMLVREPEYYPNKVNYRQYYEYHFTVPEGAMSIGKSWYMKSSGGNEAGVSYLMWNGYARATAQFHYVDDLAYRKAVDLPIKSGPVSSLELPERSADSGAFSLKPFSRLSLDSLVEGDGTPESNLEANIGNLNSATPAVSAPYIPGTTEVQIVRPDGSDPGEFTRWNFDGWMAKTKVDYYLPPNESVKRPSLIELTRSIPGYVYVSTDLDTPKGDYSKPRGDNDNSRLVSAFDPSGPRPSQDVLPQDRPADPDEVRGGYLTHRHYYLTYRALPQPFTLHKTDPDGKDLAGARFSLFAVDASGNETLIADDLVTDKSGRLGEPQGEDPTGSGDLAEIVLNNNPEGGCLYRVKDEENDKREKLYVVPGTYVLRETEAPSGYKTAADVKFTVKLQYGETSETLEKVVVDEPEPTPPTPPVTPPTTPGEPPTPEESPTPEEPPAPNKPPIPTVGDVLVSAAPIAATSGALGVFALGLRRKK